MDCTSVDHSFCGNTGHKILPLHFQVTKKVCEDEKHHWFSLIFLRNHLVFLFFLSMNCHRLGETNHLELISCILYFWALSLLTFIVLLFSSIGKVDRTCLSLKQAGAIVSGKREMVWHNFHIHNNYYFEAIILWEITTLSRGRKNIWRKDRSIPDICLFGTLSHYLGL